MNPNIPICQFCWYREGDRCYVDPCERELEGRSKKVIKLSDNCNKFDNKNKFYNLLNEIGKGITKS